MSKTVTVSPIPVANFSFGTACAGGPVQFTDKSTEANNAKLNYEWSTSNGLTSTDKDPVFAFATAGNYNIKLKVTSEAGCTDSIQLTVPVTSPAAPKWSRTIDDLNKRKLTFTPSNLNYQSYLWYFGNGDSSTATTPTYTYANYGTYNVRLLVRTTDGCVAESNDSLVVSNTSIGIAERMQAKDFVKIYPNPFHNSTRVAFTLAERSQVQVTVWDVQGRRIAILEDGNRNAGKHEYVFEADKYNAGAGVYILKVLVNDNYYTTQIVNVK
ncbi:MAG: PKD domain-containing protein [Bacteroidia bacterium]